MLQRHHIRPRFPRSSVQHNTMWSEIYMEFADITEAHSELTRLISACGDPASASDADNALITRMLIKLRAIRDTDLSTRPGSVI